MDGETRSALRHAAAIARIAEMHRRRKERQTMTDRETQAKGSNPWALGDYDRFSALVWELGPVVVEAAGVKKGHRVLDVAAGTGNTAIRAAERGARVVASDLTPEHFEAGRRRAREAGVSVEWVQADAQDLPFDDAHFDVVTSSVGVMFAPNHRRAADEMLRVLAPGGTVAIASFTPEGLAGPFFSLFAPHMPPLGPGESPPLLWGSEDHVRRLFGDRVRSIETSRRTYVERADSPRAYCELVKETFGPVVAVYQNLPDPALSAELDRAFLEFVERGNRAGPDQPVELEYEYLLVVART